MYLSPLTIWQYRAEFLWSQSPFGKAIPHFLWNPKDHCGLSRACHWSLVHPWFQASAAMLMKSVGFWVIKRRRVITQKPTDYLFIQFTLSYPIFLGSILILSFSLHLRHLTLDVETKTCINFYYFPACYIPWSCYSRYSNFVSSYVHAQPPFRVTTWRQTSAVADSIYS
jgi:hypothetical protein